MTPINIPSSSGDIIATYNQQYGMVPAKTVSLVEELGIAHPHSGPHCSDDQVTDSILKAAEKDKIPYTCVSVHTINYLFIGESEPTPTRLIEFQPSPWFYNLICAVFREVKAINANRAVNGLLGSKEELDQQMLQLACRRNYYFRVYISLNCKHFYFEPKQYGSATAVENCQIL